MEENKKFIKYLKPKNSHGYDGISVKTWKASSQLISSPVTHMCNKPLSTVVFPASPKYSEVKPLFKKGDGNTMANCRMISLLTSF